MPPPLHPEPEEDEDEDEEEDRGSSVFLRSRPAELRYAAVLGLSFDLPEP